MNDAPLNILLVDDEPLARERLRTLLADLAPTLPTRVVGEAEDGEAALALVVGAPPEQRPDAVIVDIRMPRMDGLELAQHLARRAGEAPAVIFATAYDDHALQAFEVDAVDYLVKPVRLPRLAAALDKVRRRRGEAAGPAANTVTALDGLRDRLQAGGRRFLSCHERGRILLVPVEAILYLRADTKYVAARTREREFLLDESLVRLEQEFAERFVRLHRAVLLARDALAGVERARSGEAANDGADGGAAGESWVALVQGLTGADGRLPISRRQWPQVKTLLREPS